MNIKYMICLLWMCCSIETDLFAQDASAEELIAASQTDAPRSFFKADKANLGKVTPGDYNNPAETNIRKGLPYFFEKAKSGKKLKIAYIGGSITQARAQYRTQSINVIQGMFPQAEITGINAGVSGSDTELGASRLYDHVLKYDPDLIFIEFAVNGGYPYGMEGMARQIIRHNNTIDICFIYTLMTAQFKYYQEGTISPVMQGLEEIAKHYDIPSIHLGMEATELATQGKLIPRGKPAKESMPVFSQDGVHPLETGGDFYAAAIARSFSRMEAASTKTPYELPKSLLDDNWEDAKMITPKEDMLSAGWKKIDPMRVSGLGGLKGWFPYVMTAEKAGETVRFKFKGKAFGMFDIGGPETGQLEVYLDGKQINIVQIKGDKIFKIENGDAEPLNRFNQYCNNRYRGQYFWIETEDGEHEVTFKISPKRADKKAILGASKLDDINKNPEKYDRSVIYVGKILIRGEMLQ